MVHIFKKTALISGLVMILSSAANAQTYEWTSSTEGNIWQQSKIKSQPDTKTTPLLEVGGTEEGTTFKAWGTCFNELGWDALNLLPRKQQETIQ